MNNTKIENGIIMIPDISGFTEFVFKTKLYIGEYIIRQLLSVLIEENNDYFNISEIEGDSILFYRYDEKPSYEEVSSLIRRMKQTFDAKIHELNQLLNTKIDLALKFVVHYGKFSQYKIKSFKKLYGKTVIEAHQMLKNKCIDNSCYAFYSYPFLDFKQKENQDQNKMFNTELGEYHLF